MSSLDTCAEDKKAWENIFTNLNLGSSIAPCLGEKYGEKEPCKVLKRNSCGDFVVKCERGG